MSNSQLQRGHIPMGGSPKVTGNPKAPLRRPAGARRDFVNHWVPSYQLDYKAKRLYMGGCQNYGPLLGPLNTRCRIILRIQKGTRISTSSHIRSFDHGSHQGPHDLGVHINRPWDGIKLWNLPCRSWPDHRQGGPLITICRTLRQK